MFHHPTVFPRWLVCLAWVIDGAVAAAAGAARWLRRFPGFES
jgi:hypothetical protein